MRSRQLLAVSLGLSICSTGAIPEAFANSGGEQHQANQDILKAVRTLHGLDEKHALERLAAESAASDVYRMISEADVPGFAGAWFDPLKMELVVAVNNRQGLKQVEELGVKGVMVEHSLKDLDSVLDRVAALRLSPDVFRSAYIDQEANKILLAVSPRQALTVRAMVVDEDLPISVIESDEVVTPSAIVRGGEGTRNATWAAIYLPPTYAGVYPCSTGVSHESGFYTAGHCGEVGNIMRTPSGTLLGTMTGSTYFTSNYDTGTVTTAVGQFPYPWINGYSDGQITVPAKWAGINPVPVNTTVCRYGQTSGGPFCGTVSALNVTVNIWSPNGATPGLTRVAGACTNDGDSGGPWISAADDQVQGTNSAGPSNSCPTPTNFVYFQPISYHIGFHGKSVLTAHGANAPSATGVMCPVASMSGLGEWYCKFSSWNSQGSATFSWSNGTPFPAGLGGYQVRGNCSGGTVTVNLTVANNYGTTVIPRSFPCPLGPVP